MRIAPQGLERLQQLRAELAGLRWGRNFSVPALEGDYAAWLRRERATIRIGMLTVPLLGFLLAPLYGAWLSTTDPRVLIWVRLVEFGIGAPLCAIAILSLLRNPDRKSATWAVMLAGAFVFLCLAAIRWMGDAEAGTLHAEIVLLAPLAVASLGGGRARYLIPYVLGCTAVFVLGETALYSGREWIRSLLATVIMTPLSLLAALSGDRLSRRTWLLMEINELGGRVDAVTGLANRHGLEHDAQRLFALAQREGRAVGLLMVDLDHFKQLNDRYGHLAGDRALAVVGRSLADRIGRRATDLVARLGGEEFVVLLDDPDPAGTDAVAEALVREVAALGLPNERAPDGGPLTASVGVHWSRPQSDETLEHYIRLADLGLYAAKAAGRNTWRRAPESTAG